jgi:hypothetical protein
VASVHPVSSWKQRARQRRRKRPPAPLAIHYDPSIIRDPERRAALERAVARVPASGRGFPRIAEAAIHG